LTSASERWEAILSLTGMTGASQKRCNQNSTCHNIAKCFPGHVFNCV
jgi:hypothetical protein